MVLGEDSEIYTLKKDEKSAIGDGDEAINDMRLTNDIRERMYRLHTERYSGY